MMRKNILAVIFLMLSISMYAQEIAIAPTRSNILYMGIENPIKVVVENYDCDSTFISSDMKVRRLYDCDYIVVPGKAGSASVTVGVIRNNDSILLGMYQFRVLTTPDPVAKIARKSEGVISIGLLNQAGRITAELYDFDFEVKFRIESYVVVIERDKNVIYEKDFSGNVFSSELKAQFYDLKPGDIIKFERIIASGPDNSPREILPISFRIR